MACVFEKGPHPVAEPKHLTPREVPGLPRRVMVVTPTDAGTYPYPVVVFLHGWEIVNSWYQQLLKHVASHGFIVVAPQLYNIAIGISDAKDIYGTRQVAAWLANEQHGLSYVLDSVFHLSVKPDLSRLALAGHSRGGDTAFAVALGLGETPKLAPPTFSALIGVDPVAGFNFLGFYQMQMEPKVLTFKPNSLDTGMPVLVLGTGHGGAMAPAGLNHVQFYDECGVPPNKYHFVVKDYGHLCMLDDDLLHHLLGANDGAMRAMGGVMVAFLQAKLKHHDENLKAVLTNPGLAPVVLDPVEHN